MNTAVTVVKEKAPDRRVKKTKKAIRNAFAELLSNKDINDITVKDISEAADITRKTVYNYYSGVHEILEEIENGIVSSFENIIDDIDFKNPDPYFIFEKLNEVIDEDFDFYCRLMKMDNNFRLIKKMVGSLRERIERVFLNQLNCDKKKISMISRYITTGLLGVYQEWLTSSNPSPLKELSKDISILVFSGINGLVKKQ